MDAVQRHCNSSGWLQLSGTATHLVGYSSAAPQRVWLVKSADLSYFTGHLEFADSPTVIYATLQQFIGGLTGVYQLLPVENIAATWLPFEQQLNRAYTASLSSAMRSTSMLLWTPLYATRFVKNLADSECGPETSELWPRVIAPSTGDYVMPT